jgi:hypothetical protein
VPEAPEGTQARSSGYNFVIVCCHRLLEKKEEEISSNCHGIDRSRTHTNRLMPRRAQTRLLFSTFKRGKEEEEPDDLFAYYTIEGFGLRIESE